MIVFHEGLPRAGKSYEAMSERICRWLAEGRPVVAYLEGLDLDRIAEASGVDRGRVAELLRPLTREQVKPVYLKLSNGDDDLKRPMVQPLLEHGLVENAGYVLDEAQNFWPTGSKLSSEFVEFITEHGHHGRDIVLMGQDVRDLHATWRRRVEMKFVFLKLSAVGQEGRYSVSTYRKVPGTDKFQKVGTTVRKYEARYFGTYKSHVSEATNTANYKDARASIWSSWSMRFGIPAALLVGAWGFWSAWSFFHPVAPAPKIATAAGAPLAVVARAAVPVAVAPSSPVADERPPQERLFTEYAGKFRIRLAGLIHRGDRIAGVIEWLDGSSRVVDRFSLDDLRDMGFSITSSNNFVRVALGKYEGLATMWPIESSGRISENSLNDLKAQATPAVLGGAGSLGGGRPSAVVDSVAPAPDNGPPVVVQPPRVRR